MADMIYLLAAYAVFWLFTFGFVYYMVNRQQKLEREIHLLKQLLDDEDEAER